MRNTWVIYLRDRDNSSKGGLIPNEVVHGDMDVLKLGTERPGAVR